MRGFLGLRRVLQGDQPMNKNEILSDDVELNKVLDASASMGKDYWHSEELLGDRIMTRIEHDGYVYILRVTKENRLILTK